MALADTAKSDPIGVSQRLPSSGRRIESALNISRMGWSKGSVPDNKHWTPAGHPRKRKINGTMCQKGVVAVDFAKQRSAIFQLADVQKQAGELSDGDRKGLEAFLLYGMSGLAAVSSGSWDSGLTI